MSREIRLTPQSAAILLALSFTAGSEMSQLASASMPDLFTEPRTGQPRTFPGVAVGIRSDLPIRLESLRTDKKENQMAALYLALTHNGLLSLIEDLGPDGTKEYILDRNMREQVLGVVRSGIIYNLENIGSLRFDSRCRALLLSSASGFESLESVLADESSSYAAAVFPPPESLVGRLRAEARLLLLQIDAVLSELVK